MVTSAFEPRALLRALGQLLGSEERDDRRPVGRAAGERVDTCLEELGGICQSRLSLRQRGIETRRALLGEGQKVCIPS